MDHIMLDLETLDTRPSAAIISIGAVRFNPYDTDCAFLEFHQAIDIDSNLEYKRTISGSTLLWWLDQGHDARQRIVNAKPIALRKALNLFSSFLTPIDKVWGNGASFDNAILADAYASVGLLTPWHFTADRCYRTIKALNKTIMSGPFIGVQHDALDDAKHQAWHLQKIFAETRNGKT